MKLIPPNQSSGSPPNSNNGFTRVELIVVVFLLLIFIGVLLPASNHPKLGSKRIIARTIEVNLAAAINQYEAEYGRPPISSNTITAAASNDFTFGTIQNTPVASGRVSPVTVGTVGLGGYQNNNSEIMAILCDSDFWPEINHAYNKKRDVFINAKPSLSTNSEGLGPDNVLRDPWGNPFIITLDLNGDGHCDDVALGRMYHLDQIHKGPPFPSPGNSIVWSFGQKKSIDLNQPLNSSVNQTIILPF